MRATRAFFEEWYPRLVRYLRARLGDADHAEDLAQEAFVRLLEHDPSNPAAWHRVGARLGPGGSSHHAHTLEWSLGLGVAVAIAAAVLIHATSVERWVHGWALSGGEQVRDVCCFDLDGGGPGDDGILTLSGRGERADCVLVYDDVDRSRTFSAGDRTRYVSPAGTCGRVTSEHVAMVAGRPALVLSALRIDDPRDVRGP